MKNCSLCNEKKSFDDFRKCTKNKDGYQERCRVCKKTIDQKYRDDNKEKIKNRMAEFYLKNKEKLNSNAIKWQKNNKQRCFEAYRKRYLLLDKSLLNDYAKSNRLLNIEKYKSYARNYVKNRKINDMSYRLRAVLCSRMHSAITRGSKSGSTLELTGCTIKFFKNFIAHKFTDGMTWENYGKWELDHIIPCVKFNLCDPIQQKQCFHYTNYQPLWKTINRKKGSKLNYI